MLFFYSLSSRSTSFQLCRGLEDLFGKSTVLDLGAGLGHYGRCFYRLRHNVIDAREPNEKEYLWHNYWYEMSVGQLRNKKQVVKSWTGWSNLYSTQFGCDGTVDSASSSQAWDPMFKPCSRLLNFTHSLVSTTPVSKGWWGLRGLQAYLLYNHCLASLGLTWARRGMSAGDLYTWFVGCSCPIVQLLISGLHILYAKCHPT